MCSLLRVGLEFMAPLTLSPSCHRMSWSECQRKGKGLILLSSCQALTLTTAAWKLAASFEEVIIPLCFPEFVGPEPSAPSLL